jgi:hypothetical protein
MLHWVNRRVKFIDAVAGQTQLTDRGVRVSLERQGQPFIGRSGNGNSSLDELLHGAEATLEALRQIVGQEIKLTLLTAGPVVALGQNFVLAVVEVAFKRATYTVMGVCPRTDWAARDGALAVLQATNRILGLS